MNTADIYKEIEIPVNDISLKGRLRLADKSKGIVLFSHGSGSSRLSSRNNYVANLLYEQGFSSLLFDLLTVQEDMIYENRFDIALLTNRLVNVTHWLKNNESLKEQPIGYFGASTGAASALCAAADLKDSIKAVVSRGGRPDLAMPCLNRVKCPVLLLVGSRDGIVIELNKKAQANIPGVCEINIIEGASHLFEEPGKLDLVAIQTINWFNKNL